MASNTVYVKVIAGLEEEDNMSKAEDTAGFVKVDGAKEAGKATMGLEAPWYSYAKKLKAVFAGDKDVRVDDICSTSYPETAPKSENTPNYILDIMVYNHMKFLALDAAMAKLVSFGNVTLGICLYDMENELMDNSTFYDVKTAFKNNPHVAEVKVVSDFAGTPHCFVIFKAEIIQFNADNTADVNGNWSGLAQDIAQEMFDFGPGVHFCTEEVGK